MDVDLLRPGTVPISPDTMLWFEFLLDPNLLKKHLAKPAPDPSSTDLIVKFSSIRPLQLNNGDPAKPIDLENPESPTLSIVETEKYTKKQLALKILCLKVAAYLKWNLSVWENKLPPQIQSQLTQDLVYMATDGVHSIPPLDLSDDFLERGGIKFAVVLYHRWILRFLVNRALFTRNPKQPFISMDVVPTETGFIQMNVNYDKLVAQSEDSRQRSLQFLSELSNKKAKVNDINVYHCIRVPTFDTFQTLTEDTADMLHNWELDTITISENEFFMQINYDLCANYFFYGQYDLAQQHIALCNNHRAMLIEEKHPKGSPHHAGFDWSKMDYASVTQEEIFGYMKALNISQESNTLLHQLHEASLNNYEGLIDVLQVDNIRREIPMVHRLVVELDIQGVSSSGAATVSRDLLNKIAALNVVRSLLDGNLPSVHISFNRRMKNLGEKFVDTLFWAFTPVLKSDMLSDHDRNVIKQFFIHLAASEHGVSICKINEYLASHNEIPKQLFSDKEILHIMQDLNMEGKTSDDLPLELLTSSWDMPDFNIKNIPDLDLGCLKQRLIDATTAMSIRNCLIDLAATSPPQPMWTINPQWRLPIPLQNVISCLPRGFLQDFSYIILGKAKQLAEMGDHNAALELLLILETETRNLLNQVTGNNAAPNNNSVMYKLWKLVGWEALLMQINQMLAEWPNHKGGLGSLKNKCTLCILTLQSGDTVIPRMEIVEQCYICLLNAGEWKQLAELAAGSRGTGQAEAAVAAALAAHHVRTKPTKKLPEDLWDMVSPIFVNVQSSSTKRNNAGNPTNTINREIQANNKMKDGMTSFFSKLRDPLVLSVVISLLAKLFNIQKDDSNMDLNMEYINLWPAKVSSSISLASVSATLHQLVAQALKHYPDNISWIKLLGDMSLVGGHYSTAMKQYLIALTILSDNFVQPLSKQLVEDQTIFRRMIKCCMQLNCPTQAAILCQFLDEIDYVLAFKCLSEMSHLCSDAMDSYYGCIWDTSILEYLINLHHKRGETHRKQLAVKVMGMLELNSNNNEEIQREAANKRKAKFMRALVKQYVC